TSSRLHLTVMKPGVVSGKLGARALMPGRTYTVEIVATDFDGHHSVATAKLKIPGTIAPAVPPVPSVGGHLRLGRLPSTLVAKLPAGSSQAATASAGGMVFVVGGTDSRAVLAGPSA